VGQPKRQIGKPFKPGQSGNPSGRPKLPDDVLKLKKTTQAEAEASLIAMLRMSKEELSAKLNDPKTSMSELAIGSVIAKAVKEGDQSRLGFVWDRLFGKVKEIVEQTNINIEHDPEEYKAVPREALIKLISGDPNGKKETA